ncbi:hypothetical protein LshimejAT787_0602040 [Lyophyllum shimeji]|uniref:Uncharacterized protein n=1 Tax=Lyophyllum shimeji TaxID=47721 RepID=A0A9P3UN79_LYOSH|nr:hypothetical protein LshimejAT787_0602040 [Lyophyllum shimeji]
MTVPGFCKISLRDRQAVQERLLVPSTHSETETNLVETFRRLVTAYPAAYQTLAEEEPIACSTTGASFDPAPAPVAVISYYFLLPPLRATRALTGRSVRIIAFDPLGSAAFLRDWGLEFVDGPGDFGAKVDPEVARTGKSTLKVGNELYYHLDGSVIRVPGLPAMYDHEFFQRKWPTPILIRSGVESVLLPLVFAQTSLMRFSFAKDSDALLIASSDEYEKAPLDAVRACRSVGRRSLKFECQNLPGQRPKKIRPTFRLFQVSFGSMSWPTKPEYVEEAVEALLERKLPFTLSHASPVANIPEGLSEDVLDPSPFMIPMSHVAGWIASTFFPPLVLPFLENKTTKTTGPQGELVAILHQNSL